MLRTGKAGTSALGAKDAWQCSPLQKLVIGSASVCLEHQRPSKQPQLPREAPLLQSKSRHFGEARLTNGCLELHQHWKIRIPSFLVGAQRAQPNQTKTDCTLNAAELDAWESQTAFRNAGRDAGNMLTPTCNVLPQANAEDANANEKRYWLWGESNHSWPSAKHKREIAGRRLYVVLHYAPWHIQSRAPSTAQRLAPVYHCWSVCVDLSRAQAMTAGTNLLILTTFQTANRDNV